MKLRLLLWAGLCVAGGQAHAGLFADDEARARIQQIEARAFKLEESGKQQAETNNQQIEADKQQTRSLLDMQSQIEAQNVELRGLRGQIEELMHNLQDAEKRQKDFYIDLDTRIRHFESVEAANAAAPPVPQPEKAAEVLAADDEVVVENRAYEAAHGFFKAGDHQKAITAFREFLDKFPESVHVPNANYEIGTAYFALKDCKNALASYQVLVGKYAFSPKAPDAMLSMADCQQELQDMASAKKTLRQIIAKFPGSETANEAKKRLAAIK